MKGLIFLILFSAFLLNIVCLAQVLTVDGFSLKANGNAAIISLKENGEVTVDDQNTGRLSGDGQSKDTNGKTLAAIDKQGKQ